MKVTLVRARAVDSAIYKVAETLSKNGHEVTLLVWDRQGTLKGAKDSRGYKLKIFNLRAPYDKISIFLCFPIWWAYLVFFLWKEKSDVIHVSDLDTLWPSIIVKPIKGVKLFYTIYDFYASNTPKIGSMTITKGIQNTVAFIEKLGIGFTDVLFLVDESRIREVKGSRVKKIVYIYNSPPDYLTQFNKQETQDKKDLIIFYTGVIHRTRGLEYMIKAVENLDHVKLIIAGTGLDVNSLKKQITNNEKVQYLGWLPSYEDVLIKTLESDVLFRFGDPSIPKCKYESPNKLFEAMMAGKPFIVNSEIGASRIVRDENCGFIVPYGDAESLKKVIIKLRDNSLLRRQLGANGRKAYEEKYSWSIMEKRLLTAYKDIALLIN